MKHIEVHELSGRYVLGLRDSELFDYLEDHFTEIGVVPDVVFPNEDQEKYQLWLPAGTSKAAVMSHLARLSEVEVERIASINAGGAGVSGAT